MLNETSEFIEINESRRELIEQMHKKEPNFLDNAKTSNSIDLKNFQNIFTDFDENIKNENLKKKTPKKKILDNIFESKFISSINFTETLIFIQDEDKRKKEKFIIQNKIKSLKILDNVLPSIAINCVIFNKEDVFNHITNPSLTEKEKEIVVLEDKNNIEQESSIKKHSSSSYDEEEKEKNSEHIYLNISVADLDPNDEGNQTKSAHNLEVTNFAACENDDKHQNISIIEDYEASKSGSKFKKSGTFEEKSISQIDPDEKKIRESLNEEENKSLRNKKNFKREKSLNILEEKHTYTTPRLRRTVSNIQEIASDDYMSTFNNQICKSSKKKLVGNNVIIAKQANENLTNMDVRISRSDFKNVVKKLNFGKLENKISFENKSNSLDSKKQKKEESKLNLDSPSTPRFPKQKPFSLNFNSLDLENLVMKNVSPQKPLPKQNLNPESNFLK